MGLLLWPIALVVFVAWSLFAWLMYGLSEGAAALLAGAMTGILSADLGPWAAWIMASLGGLLQIAVLIVWALVSLAIFAAPVLLRRKRRSAAYSSGYHAQPYDARGYASPGLRYQRGYDDLRELRGIAEDMVRQYRHKKRKKRWKDDD
jgi:hypothetical protein